MSVIVNNIKLKLSQPKEEALEKAVKLLKIPKSRVEFMGIAKTSLDARKQSDIRMVYSVSLKISGDEEKLVNSLKNNDIRYAEEKEPEFEIGSKEKSARPYIVGFGPGGMFAALTLAQKGYRPIVLERGQSIDERVKSVSEFWQSGRLNPECNVQFGEGGAGTFSDGKLTCRVKSPFNGYVLREFVKCGAPKDILYKAKPHIGTDILREVVKNIRKEIENLGGEVLFSTSMEDIKIQSGKITEIKYNNQWHRAETLILAPGHSARDTFRMLFDRGVFMENKPFSVGVRVEHLQENLNRALYGKNFENPLLPQGEYQLSHRKGERAVYTFCMCPGGLVVPSASEEGGVVTNGMSEYARDRENANSAFVVSVNSEDFGNNWDSGIIFQRELEQKAYNLSKSYKAPCQTVGNFLAGRSGCDFKSVKPSYSLGVEETDFNKFFPAQITELMHEGLMDFDRKIKGFAAVDSVFTGVETRTSSPVRISRGENKQALGTEGLYPCGEGAGYAGGIMSAAMDGIAVAQEIMKIYKP